jgi:hypothetical protein
MIVEYKGDDEIYDLELYYQGNMVDHYRPISKIFSTCIIRWFGWAYMDPQRKRVVLSFDFLMLDNMLIAMIVGIKNLPLNYCVNYVILKFKLLYVLNSSCNSLYK